MPRLRRFLTGLRALLFKSRSARELRELNDELQQYMEAAHEAQVASGLTGDEARRAARLAVGNIEAAKDNVRDVGWETRVESVWRDVRHALRLMRKAPGFSAAVIVTLGLGIGGTTAVFSVVDALFWRAPDGVADPALVRRVFVKRDTGGMQSATAGMWPDSRVIRERSRAFAAIAAFVMPQDVSLGRGETATEASASVVSADFFEVIGSRPAVGRFFTDADDEVPGVSPVVVIGYSMWENRFGGSADVLSQTLLVNNHPLQIIGVTARGFRGIDAEAVDLWLPSAMAHSVGLESRDSWRTGDSMSGTTRHIARLWPTADSDRAAAEASVALAGAVEANSNLDPTPEVVLQPIVLAALPGPSWAVDLSLWLLMAAALVLVISCANVANLLLARGVTRRRELAMRLSLGAGAGRIARQQLTESLVLGVCGGAAGVAIAWLGIKVMQRFPLPPTAGHVDGRLLAFSLVLSLVTACVFGVLPAVRSVRIDPVQELKGAGTSPAPSTQRTRLTLVTVQVALSFALLVGAALFVRSLAQISAVEGGADLNRLLTVQVNLSGSDQNQARPYNQFFQAATSRLATVPGVESAALIHTPPFSRWGFSVVWQLPGQAKPQVGGTVNVAGAGYFETAGTKLLRGRTFQASDDVSAEPVAVVNEAMAKLLTAEGIAIGSCVTIRAIYLDRMPCVTVVGIVESQRNDYLKAAPAPIIFLAEPQVPPAFPRTDIMLMVRTAGPATDRRGAVQAALQALGQDLPYVKVEPLATRLKDQLRPIQLGAMLFSLFGVLALVLSAIGLAGVLGYFVAERTSEVGIRRALGAPADSVVGLVLRQGLLPVGTGLIVGLGLSLTGVRVLESQLFGIGPYDLVAFASAAAFLVALAAVATTLPIVRALRIDPMVALRRD